MRGGVLTTGNPFLDYFIWLLFSFIGMIEIGASLSELRGLWLVKNKRLNIFLASFITLGAYIFFFSTDRNLFLGIEGSQQFALYLAGLVSAIAVVIFISSILNRNMRGKGRGLNALKNSSFINLWRRNAS